MNAHVNGRTFKSGNSEAVRLPKGVGFGIGVDLHIERDGEKVVLTPVHDPAAIKREWLQLLDDLEAIGRPPGPRQEREPFEFPERKGL
jgi:antitoxin VapB